MRVLLALAIAAAALLSLVAHLPLRWFAPAALGTASGTVWEGQITAVPLLGSVSVDTGPGYVDIATPPGEVTLRGRVSPSSVSDLSLGMPVSRLPTNEGRLAGLAGRFSLRLDSARLEDGVCAEASGTASTDMLAANGGRFGWTGPELSGPVDCVDGRLRVRMSGESADGTVESLTTTGADGVYQSEITVRSSDPAAGNALVLFGFNRAGDGEYRLAEQGRWR